MKGLILTLILPVLLLSISCSQESATVSEIGRTEIAMDYAAPAMSRIAVEPQGNNPFPEKEETRIQLNASLSLKVKNLDQDVKRIQNMVSHYSARVTNSNSGRAELPYVNMTILVPRSSFNDLLTDIKQIGESVTNENIQSTDVTEQFIDIEAKLNVMKKTEDRFIELMSDTHSIEEIIQVEKELMRIRGDIDSLEGRINYLSKTTENSIIDLHMTQEASIAGSRWNPKDSLNDSIRFLVSFLKHLADLVIWVFVFAPIILILGVISYLIYRWVKKTRYRLKTR